MQAISNHFQMLLSKEMMYGPYLEVSKFYGCVAFESNIFVIIGNLAEFPQRSMQRRSSNLFLAACRPYRDPPQRHDLGRMDVACSSCGALHWMVEKLSDSSKRNPRFGTCCMDGKVQLPPLQPPPEPLR